MKEELKDWAIAACNGRMYFGRVTGGWSDLVDLDPAYEMMILQTPKGPMRVLEYVFMHASITKITLHEPTLVSLADLWPSEVDWYMKTKDLVEKARVEERAAQSIVKIAGLHEMPKLPGSS
jgi:hypothetical protein